MGDDLNLASVPPDIILLIIPMVEELMNEMRLIAPSWNTTINKYLSRPCNLPVLERAYLFANQCEKRDEDDDDDDEDMMKAIHRRHEERKRLFMYAILPIDYAERVGLGRWLDICHDHIGSVEVKSVPIKLRLPNEEDEVFVFDIVAIALFIVCAPAFLIFLGPYFSALAISALVMSLVVYLYSHNCNVVARTEKLRSRHHRFFASFSKIDELVMEKLEGEVYEDAVNLLGNIPINRLEVREHRLNGDILKRTTDLCRKHDIRHVFLDVYEFQKKIEFKKFVIELMALGVHLDIYEGRHYDFQKYFRLSREEWELMARDLSTAQISLRITTIHDATFNHSDYEFRARAHIRCEKIGHNSSLPLLAMKKSRGFNLH